MEKKSVLHFSESKKKYPFLKKGCGKLASSKQENTKFSIIRQQKIQEENNAYNLDCDITTPSVIPPSPKKKYIRPYSK